jgi:ribosomal protein S18 acetylase RimI-like enzyme
MKIQFREAAKEDIPDILAMMKAFNAIDNYAFEPELREQNITWFISNKELGRMWMIPDNAAVIGYLVLTFGFSFEFKGRDAFVDELYLHEDYRSKGIGSMAIDFVLHEATLLGIKAIHLEVEKHNEKGNRLYTKKGFKEHNRFLMTNFLG